MIEGQNGLNWPRWKRIVQTVEELGYAGLFRSDHFTNPDPPNLDSLDAWTTLTWLADRTQRLRFGPLVSPVSFRHPAHTARIARDIDDLSGGRLTLGLGAGWNEREHHMFCFDLLPVPERFARFREGIEVVTRLLRSDQPVNFQGQYYCLHDAILLPRPGRAGGPPILIGGNGPERTLPLVARYADEWNAVSLTPDEFRQANARLNKLIQENGRQPEEVRRSMMTGCVFGSNPQQVQERVARRTQGKRTPEELREHGLVVGTIDEIRVQLRALEAAGLQMVMLQWLDLEDMPGLEQMATLLSP